MGDETHHVEANGLRFAYLEEGRGPLVLLLHGFPDTAHSWDHVRPRIAARGLRAVSPWMRGYAPTAIPPRDADFETLARDALALITALGETSAVIVGHDWGAAAAYGAAALEPARVARLIPVGIPHPATLKPSPINLWRARHFVRRVRRSRRPQRHPRRLRRGPPHVPGRLYRRGDARRPLHAPRAPRRLRRQAARALDVSVPRGARPGGPWEGRRLASQAAHPSAAQARPTSGSGSSIARRSCRRSRDSSTGS